MNKSFIINSKFFNYFFGLIFLWACSGGSDSPTEPQEPAPVSNFTATPTTLIQGQAVTFTSTSTGTITSYAWNVDDNPAIEGITATYAHTYEEVGTYSITLTVTGPGGSNPKTVVDMITVSTAAPTPTTETSQTVQEDGSTTISLTATDPNGQAVTFAITTDPTNGTATLSGTEITYTPNANFYGTDSVAYTASNGTYTSDPVTITITVEGEDDGNPTTNDVSATTDEDTAVTLTLDATEIDGDTYSFSIISQSTNGTLGSINGNQVEYTPNQDFNGTDTFTFEAADDRTFRRNVATATITVNAVNDAPVANDVTASMNENKEFTRLMPVTITLDATDVEGDDLTYSIVGTPSNGTLGSITNNQVVYTPTQDWNGEDTFTYKANDGTDDSNTATVTVTVTSVNDAPVTTDQSASTDEDTAVDITLTATDVENDNLTFTIVSDVSNGTTSLSGTTVTYTPTANFNGTDTFTFKANDGTDDSNTSTVTITVASVNDAPVANDVTASMNENKEFTRLMPVTITLDATDVEGDDLTYSIVGTPSNGTLGSITNNQVVYTPTQDWNGEDTFTYKANDGTDDSNTATVTVTVTSVNDAPVTTDQSASTDEDTAVDITLDGSDVDSGDTLTYSIVSDVSNGSTSLSGSTVTYTPDANWNGTDTFTYKVNDGDEDSNTSTVTITVNSVNDAPTVNTTTIGATEDTARTFTTDDSDVDGDNLTFSIVSNPSNGSASISGSTFTYTPALNFNGSDSFTYKANDGTVDSATAKVNIFVTSVNDAPVASAVSASTNEDTAKAITLSATDVDNSSLTYSIVSNPSNGSLGSVSGTGVTYTPSANFNGTDTFTYKANDGTSDSNTATVTITVNAVNDAPVANDVTASTTSRTGNMRQAVTITLDATDVEGDDLTYSLVSDVSNGTTSLSGNVVTYTPTANYDGTDTFTYKANDGTVDSNTATGIITITDTNQAPIANDMTISLYRENTITFDLDATDQDGDSLSKSIVSQPTYGTILPGVGLTVQYGTNIDYSKGNLFPLTDSFTYLVSDDENNSSEATVTIEVGEGGRFFLNDYSSSENFKFLGIVQNSFGQNIAQYQDENDNFKNVIFNDNLEVLEINDVISGGVVSLDKISSEHNYHKYSGGFIFPTIHTNGIDGRNEVWFLDENLYFDDIKKIPYSLDYQPDPNFTAVSNLQSQSNLEEISSGKYLSGGDFRPDINSSDSVPALFYLNEELEIQSHIDLSFLEVSFNESLQPPRYIKLLSDGNIFFTTYSEGWWQWYHVKMDLEGNVIWFETTRNRPDLIDPIIIEASNGDIVIMHNREIVSLDQNGNTIFIKQLANIGDGSRTQKVRAIIEHSAGGYILAGASNAFEYRPQITYMDSNGNIIWTKAYGNSDLDGYDLPFYPGWNQQSNIQTFFNLIESSDGNIIAGYNHQNEIEVKKGGIVKVDINDGTKLLP